MVSAEKIEMVLCLLAQGLRYTEITAFAKTSLGTVGRIAQKYDLGRGQGYGLHLPHYQSETRITRGKDKQKRASYPSELRKPRTKDKQKRSPYHPEMLQKAIELRKQGHTLAEIGEELGRSRQAVSVLLKRHITTE